MTVTTEEAEELALRVEYEGGLSIVADALRSLAAESDALQARVAELEGALKDAAASVGEWGAYASQYLQEKWGLPGEVARYIAIAEGKKDDV